MKKKYIVSPHKTYRTSNIIYLFFLISGTIQQGYTALILFYLLLFYCGELCLFYIFVIIIILISFLFLFRK